MKRAAAVDNRSKPYFFAFDRKTKPGVLIAHCIRFETIKIKAPFDLQFDLVGNDKFDPRTKKLIRFIRTKA